jgi:RimJ/RimL family protein N-acetyltransferase
MTPTLWLNPVTLQGTHATLVPISPSFEQALAEASSDGELWKLWFTHVPSPAEMADEIDRRLARQALGEMLPFAVLDHTGRAVGMTTFLNPDPVHRRVEIGATWYAQGVQRTPLNTECKLLMMTHAFEALDCIAVEFRTSALNRRSRYAIERLGARLDGILRSHQRHRNGTLRDTCVYSVIASEWPTVQAHLRFELSRTP